MEKGILYVAPQVDVLEVEVEKGFATSGSAGDGYDENDNIIDI